MTILFGFLAFLIPLTILGGFIYFIVKSVRNVKEGEVDKSLTVREIFVDAGMFISLLTSIVALISIIFSAIDKKYIDVLKADYYSSTVINDDVRIAVSIILVAYPIYLILAFYRAKYLKENKDRRELKAIKYVNYVTLFMSALFIIGSLVTTIYEYLGGELGIAFFYKILTVVIVSLMLALYSYFTLKREYNKIDKNNWHSKIPMIFAIASLLLVVLSVVYSVKILGSPAQVRKMRFDEKRLQDLSNIQQQILNYWTTHKNLPVNISDIQGDGFNYDFVIPSDPRNKDSYEYKVIEDSKMIKAEGKDCSNYYPGKGVVYAEKIGSTTVYPSYNGKCEIPSKATFEICANFETVRAYDENGVDQSGSGWDSSNALGVSGITASSPKYYIAESSYYYGGGSQNSPNWNHNTGKTCFKRVIDPLKYPQY